MKLLIFDTETTGLPLSRKPAIEGPNNWPHLVSIAWVIVENNVITSQHTYMIKPIGWVIPEDSIKIHGITNYLASAQGSPLGDVMKLFLEQDYDVLVAHNVEFDKNVIINAILWDLNMTFPGFKGPTKCTMNLSKPVCRLPGRFGFKPPKLSELYYYIFKRHPNKTLLHSALYDVTALTECIQHSTWLRHLVVAPVLNGNGDSPKELSFDFIDTT
jgi:DNA polymerase-3 subunit epsilon